MLVAAALLLLAGVIGLIRLVPTEVRPASEGAMSEELRPALLIAQPLVAGTMTDSSIAFANEVNGLVSQQLPGFSVVENERRSAEGMTLDWVYVTGEASRLFFAVGDRGVMDDVINRVTPIGTTPEFDLYAWPDRTWNRTVAAVSGTTVVIVDSEAFTIDGEALSEDMLIQLVEALALRVGLA
jgi:hypothetical protein